MSGTDLIIALSVGLIAIAFVVLVIYLVMALTSLKKTIETTNVICRDLENKIHAFDPYMRIISGFGQTMEKKTTGIRDLSNEVCEGVHIQRKEKATSIVNTSVEVAEWALLGLALWQKIKERK